MSFDQNPIQDFPLNEKRENAPTSNQLPATHAAPPILVTLLRCPLMASDTIAKSGLL